MSNSMRAFCDVVNLKGVYCINDELYERKRIPGQYDVRVQSLGDHGEVSARQSWGLVPLDATDDQVRAFKARAANWGKDWPDWWRERVEAENAARNAERAARRAKTRVRHLVKTMGLDAMLTLTYRENVQDFDLVRRHLKEFVRRLRRLLPGWCYVAALERQKRGAWHVHIATHALPRDLPWSGVKVKSYNVVRAVWRAVVGDLGGNIDQSRRKGLAGRSCAKLAGYLSKYMTKAYEDGDDWKNRFSSSSCAIPKAVRRRFEYSSLVDMIVWAYEQAPAGAVTSPHLGGFKDVFFLSIGPGLPPD